MADDTQVEHVPADQVEVMDTGWANRIVDGTIHLVAPDQLLANPLNARRHPGAQRDVLREALDILGWIAPMCVNIRTGRMVDGHARVEEALSKGAPLIPVYYVDLSEEEERIALASFDPISNMAVYDPTILDDLLADLNLGDGPLAAMLAELNAAWPALGEGSSDGTDGDGAVGEAAASLAERFGVPPFSVLDARQGYWQTRKRAWLALGIRSELGRGEDLLVRMLHPDQQVGKRLTYVASDKPIDEMDEVSAKILERGSGTSIFDPVLCELAYRWFTPPAGTVLDPFAGGSVRGIVAAALGHPYIGVDLSADQVGANVTQWADLNESVNRVHPNAPEPTWVIGDSSTPDTLTTAAPAPVDFVFSCPPYGDLEAYSDDPADLSKMKHPEFITAYRAAIANAVDRLADDRFACVVVGDFRDKQGNYRNFVSDTIAAFLDSGCHLYNEAILITAVSSLPLRAGRQFTIGRKLGKTHQNVLVFVKGDPKGAVKALGDVVEFGDLAWDDPNGIDLGQSVAPLSPVVGSDGMMRVKVSAASARQEFNGCDPDYIRTTCHASCCRSSTSPTGTMITVHPTEEAAIRARGANVINGLLQPKPGAKRCPFQNTGTHLCDIHFTPDKPFGCIASPFTLTKNGQTLIIRNRYRSLKCYKDGKRLPAYVAFRASLDLIFGNETAQRIHDHLAGGGGDLTVGMPARSFAMLTDNDDIKHAAMASV
jgi:Fe-S-cluster containining protein